HRVVKIHKHAKWLPHGFGVRNRQSPAIRFITGSQLSPVEELLAVLRKHRPAIRCLVIFRQAFPISGLTPSARWARDRHAADIVVRAPRFTLLGDGGEYQIFTIRAEGEIVA